MNLSIVVPAFNEEKLLGATLDHIDRARRGLASHQWNSEVIVCDNNSTDRTAALAREAGARVVFEPVNQIARARNAGAAAATGRWLLFVDADSTLTAELMQDLAATLKTGRWLGGGCVLRLDRPVSVGVRLWVGLWNLISRCLKYAAGSFVCCRADAFREMGGFSERFFAGEEIEFCQRLKRRARRQGLGVFILRRHPMVTSARKLKLYSRRELWRTVARSVLHPRRFKSRPEECHMWYDGRR